MGLVVVDPDEKASDTLRQQLAHLNLESLPAVNAKIAQELCDHALPELMICSRMDWAQSLARANRRLPVVLATPHALDRDALLDALRGGLADVWQLPVEDDFARERISDILEASRNAASQAEARLHEHVEELQRDQRAGRYIQMGMLPPNPMGIDRYRLQHRIIPSLMLVSWISTTPATLELAEVSANAVSESLLSVMNAPVTVCCGAGDRIQALLAVMWSAALKAVAGLLTSALSVLLSQA